MVFPVVMYGCESWTIKTAEHQRIDAFELWCWRRLLRVPWTARRSNQSILKEISPGGFTGKTDIEAETPILWPPDVKSWLVWNDPDFGKDGEREEKGTTEDEMVGCHHRHNEHGFGWTPEVGDGQGGLACCSPWGHKESNMSEQLNWNRTCIFKLTWAFKRKTGILLWTGHSGYAFRLSKNIYCREALGADPFWNKRKH